MFSSAEQRFRAKAPNRARFAPEASHGNLNIDIYIYGYMDMDVYVWIHTYNREQVSPFTMPATKRESGNMLHHIGPGLMVCVCVCALCEYVYVFMHNLN